MNTQHATIATLGECIAFDPARSGLTAGLQNRTRNGEDMTKTADDVQSDIEEQIFLYGSAVIIHSYPPGIEMYNDRESV